VAGTQMVAPKARSKLSTSYDVALAVGVEGFGAADDLHDLGRDRVLTGPVHHPAQRLDQLLGVVGRGLHRPLTERVLGRCGVEQRCVHTGFDVAREQRVEDRLRVGLEVVVAAGVTTGLAVATLDRLGRSAARAAAARPPGCRRDEPGVDELDAVDLAGGEQLDDVLADRSGVLVARLVGEPVERLPSV
jgi:hypothetical protein